MSLKSRIANGHWSHERPASGLGIDLGRVADHRAPGGLILLEGCEPWGAEHVIARPHWCPVCRGLALARKRYCLACDACGLDGRIAYPGEAVDSRLNPGWTATPTAVTRAAKLRGGLGERVGRRRKERQRVSA